MATYDNKHWLLSNIRNSFISTDDTGMCEIVLAGENFPKILYNRALEDKMRGMRDTSPHKLKEAGDSSISTTQDSAFKREIITEYDPYPNMVESDDEDLISGSYIRYEDFGPHRQRSNTAQWLDKKEAAMKKAAKIKLIKWETPREMTLEEKAEIFKKKECLEPIPNQGKSMMTRLLETSPHLPHEQYLEYAKYDGTAQVGLPTKTFKIFMTMLSEKHQNYPVHVCIIANAKIQDLIGFTCYKYSIENPDILLGSAHSYGLCIAEDDGEVDWAFPCLDSNEPCSKFGFTHLGLIDLKNKIPTPTSSSLPDHGGLSGAFPMIYPKASESGQSQPNTSRQSSGNSAAISEEIRVITEDKKRANRDAELDKFQLKLKATEAPQYKAYKVQLLHKVRTNTQVYLSITLDRIEVEPLISASHKFFVNVSRKKFFVHSIDSVAWCQILEVKTNKTTFRLVYSRGGAPSYDRTASDYSGFFHPNSSYKHHDFECDHETAKEIVDKVNRILDLRNSPCRREYKTAKEKKMQARRSLNPKHLSCS